MRTLLLAALAAGLLGLSNASSAPVRAKCPDLRASDYYFDVKALGAQSETQSAFLSSDLSAAEERSLSCETLDAQAAYRLIWTRSFSKTLIVHVSKQSGSVLFVTSAVQPVPIEAGPVLFLHRLDRRRIRRLPASAWSDLQAAVDTARFWDLPSSDDRIGFDGETILIEGRVGSRYHVVERWEPVGKLRALGELIESLSGGRGLIESPR